MKDTARVILTLECPRRCPYCVNEYPGVLEQARPLRAISDLAKYQIVCLTGGEPMYVMPDKTIALAYYIRSAFPGMKIYCYIAGYRRFEDVAKLLDHVDGVHYTMHASSGMEDLGKFYIFQDMAEQRRGKSFRLYIHPHILVDLLIAHGVWSRVEMKPWLGPEDCCIPENEDLYIWRSQ